MIKVKQYEEVTYTAGKNLRVKRDVRNLTFALANDITVNSENVETTLSIGKGDATNPTVNIQSAKAGLDMGNAVLTNVESGIKLYPAGTTPVTTAKSGLADLANSTSTNVVTVADAAKLGWLVSADKTTTDATTGTANANAYAANVTTANEEKFVGKGYATVSGATDSNGVRTITVSVGNVGAGQINADGSVTETKAGLLTAEEGAKLINGAGWLTNVTNATTGLTETKVVTPGTQVNYVNGLGTDAKVSANASTGGLDVTFNVKSANPETLTVDGNGVKVNTGSITEATDVAGDANRGKVTVAAGEGNKVATVQNVANAINSASWTVKVADTQEEITTSTTNDQGSSVRAGNEITHVAGKNLKVKRDGSAVTYALANDVSVNTVTVGAGNAATTVTTLSSAVDGATEVKLTDAAGKATRVTNVAAGLNDTDAVNVSQLRNSNAKINQNIAHLDNKVNRMGKDLRAGIAGSNAAAGLPQVYIPGKSMVAAAAGTFKGQSAVAVGYSRASDNGKVILKLQGNANTRGEVGGSVGVGYQW